MAGAWIGTSGFTYPHRRVVLYPKGLPQAKWFDHYAQHFNSVELNVTFYRLPPPATFEGWARRALRAFLFAIKGSRLITPIRHLSRAREPLEALFGAAKSLGNRLACASGNSPLDSLPT